MAPLAEPNTTAPRSATRTKTPPVESLAALNQVHLNPATADYPRSPQTSAESFGRSPTDSASPAQRFAEVAPDPTMTDEELDRLERQIMLKERLNRLKERPGHNYQETILNDRARAFRGDWHREGSTESFGDRIHNYRKLTVNDDARTFDGMTTAEAIAVVESKPARSERPKKSSQRGRDAYHAE